MLSNLVGACAAGHEGVTGDCRLHCAMGILGRRAFTVSFPDPLPKTAIKDYCNISRTSLRLEHARGAALRVSTTRATISTWTFCVPAVALFHDLI